MITSFTQVGLEGLQRLLASDHSVVRLTPTTVGVLSLTVVIKGACWFAYRLNKNSSVQALAADAWTDGEAPLLLRCPPPGLRFCYSCVQHLLNSVPIRRILRKPLVGRPTGWTCP